MKLRFLFSLMLGATLAANAQGGYQDGVDNYNAGRLDVAKVILNNTINDASTDKAVAYYYLGDIAYSEGDLAQPKPTSKRAYRPTTRMRSITSASDSLLSKPATNQKPRITLTMCSKPTKRIPHSWLQ